LALCIPLNSLLSWLTIARVSATSNRWPGSFDRRQ
jgi:hypothetical protein